MTDEDLDKKLDEGLALLKVLRPPVRRVAVVLDSGGVELLRPADIVYFTTSDEKDRRLYVYTADGKQHFNFRGLSDVEELFKDDPRFMRVHKSFVVNLEQVASISQAPDGRTLHFAALPTTTIGVPQDKVAAVYAYFGIDLRKDQLPGAPSASVDASAIG